MLSLIQEKETTLHPIRYNRRGFRLYYRHSTQARFSKGNVMRFI